MLSNDKNVENIAQLIELMKNYLSLQTEYTKLTIIDKVVRLLTALVLALLFFFIALAILLFFWFGVTYFLSEWLGTAGAFLTVAAFHVVILILFYIFRKAWIERPLVRFLADLLLS